MVPIPVPHFASPSSVPTDTRIPDAGQDASRELLNEAEEEWRFVLETGKARIVAL